MPVRTPSLVLAVVLVTVLLVGACAGSPGGPPDAAARPPAVDPPAQAAEPVEAGPPTSAGAQELELTIPAGTMPDGTELEVVLRSVEVGDRREVVLEAPDGVVDHHVIDGDRHWWWIPPSARELAGGVEWIHLDVAEVAQVGELPDLVADARVPLPLPGELATGAVVAGHEVLAVHHIDADEDRLQLAGLDRPAVLRRRSLPPGTDIELPPAATELRDLPEALGW